MQAFVPSRHCVESVESTDKDDKIFSNTLLYPGLSFYKGFLAVDYIQAIGQTGCCFSISRESDSGK